MTQSSHPIRVLVAKPGLDGHDRGAKVIARALRDSGMEVIYTGIRQTPQMIVQAAIQEDVDVLGVSILSGAQMTVFPLIMELVRTNNNSDILVVGGGVIPDDEVVKLKQMGVKEILLQATPPQEIIESIQHLIQERGPR